MEKLVRDKCFSFFSLTLMERKKFYNIDYRIWRSSWKKRRRPDRSSRSRRSRPRPESRSLRKSWPLSRTPTRRPSRRRR
jgi:hypothetical protein